jgi:hypothetical protein
VWIHIALALSCQTPADEWHGGLRVDPVVAAVLGVSVGVDAMNDATPFRASAAAFHVDVPAFLVPVITSGAPGVHVTEDAIQLAVFDDLDEGHRGFFVGPELYLYALTYKLGGDTAVAHEIYAHATGGYTWFPFGDVFFVEPWATLGVPVFHSGGAVVDGKHVVDRVFNWHATVALGVRFP